ncbi:MAG: hypothetical protein R1F54_08940 [Candidatus Zeuxoniibacter abyssi]|nr:MAG: hypothetical protein R1F54_08940 [Candidatus Persebacteraceae bacterium AB1(2)]
MLKDENYERLKNVIRGERSHLAMYVGYPTCIIKCRNFNGGYSCMVEPFLLFPVELDDPPHLDISFPIINQKTLKSYIHADNSEEIMNELIQLEAALEINNEDNIGALAKKLQDIRPQWNWRETINPNRLDRQISLANVDKEGIYNRAVVVIGSRSDFTKGLEKELKDLSQLPATKIKDTALGQWLSGVAKDKKNASMSQTNLIEVFPINHEQRKAIKSALTQPLTVITDPPGTGKSQVVTNLLLMPLIKVKAFYFPVKIIRRLMLLKKESMI